MTAIGKEIIEIPATRIVHPWCAWLAAVLIACLGLGALVASPAGAAGIGGPPVVEDLSSAEAGGQVEVVAKVVPDGLETVYAIEVECGALERAAACDPLASPLGTAGLLAASYEADEVRLDVTSLQQGFYEFEVVATNVAGKVTRREQLDRSVGLPLPVQKGNPYVSPNAGGAEWAQRSSELQVAEAHAAEKAKEEQERVAQEAAQRAARPALAVPPHCVVPALVGHTLAGARWLLLQAHCKLGHVTYPRSRHGRLRVVKQSHAGGLRLPVDTAVAVRLVR